MMPPWSNLFVADVVVLGAPKFLKFVADDDVVTLHFRVTSRRWMLRRMTTEKSETLTMNHL